MSSTCCRRCGPDARAPLSRRAVQPFEEGRFLAANIPRARFVGLEGRNHLILEGTRVAEVPSGGRWLPGGANVGSRPSAFDQRSRTPTLGAGQRLANQRPRRALDHPRRGERCLAGGTRARGSLPATELVHGTDTGMNIQSKFSRLGTDSAPGQEVRLATAAGRLEEGGCAAGRAGRLLARGCRRNRVRPTPGALEEFVEGVHRGGSQAYTEYRGGSGAARRLAEQARGVHRRAGVRRTD